MPNFGPGIRKAFGAVDVNVDLACTEEGTGVTSDVVKVKGEDPATPGPLP